MNDDEILKSIINIEGDNMIEDINHGINNSRIMDKHLMLALNI